MPSEHEDPILDACLDELLGGHTPPDLTARILQAWAVQQSERLAPPVEPLPPPLPSVVAAIGFPGPADAAAPLVQIRTSTASRTPAHSAWSPAGIGAVALIASMAIGGIALVVSQQNAESPVAGKPGLNQPDAADSDLQRAGAKQIEIASGPGKSSPARSPENTPPTIVRQDALPPVRVGTDPQPPLTASVDSPSVNIPSVAPETDTRALAGSSDEEILAFINQSLARIWKENGVKPAEAATDAEWCRRLYLRVVGRIPTVEEARGFLEDKSPDKRPKLVAELLSNAEYVEQYARHWSTIWSNLLIGRTGGSEGLANRDGLQQYLAHSLQSNKPYDRMVFELLTATGSSKPGAPDYNGAVNFLLAGMKDDAALATGRTTRVFLGQQLQCAQCHQHPTGDWSQHQFWAMNSFFRQLKVDRNPEAIRLVNADFVSKSGDLDEAEVYYQVPSGELKAAYPQLPDGTVISPTGLVSEVNRREELAKWIVKSDELPQAYINRLWSQFFGYGFTRPVDDMGQHNQPAHAEVLDRLAHEFAAHGYDMKKVVGWLVLSDPFGRSSKIPPGQLASADMPEAGTTPLFSHYYARQLQVEEVYDSLLIAAKLRSAAGGSPNLEQAKLEWLAQFNRPMGTDDGAEETHFDGSIRQSIIMLNGDLMQQAVNSEHEGLLNSVVRGNLKLDEKLEHLFLAALSRKPTKRELDAAQKIVKGSGGKENQALADVWWALLNSNEFILDH